MARPTLYCQCSHVSTHHAAIRLASGTISERGACERCDCGRYVFARERLAQDRRSQIARSRAAEWADAQNAINGRNGR